MKYHILGHLWDGGVGINQNAYEILDLDVNLQHMNLHNHAFISKLRYIFPPFDFTNEYSLLKIQNIHYHFLFMSSQHIQ